MPYERVTGPTSAVPNAWYPCPAAVVRVLARCPFYGLSDVEITPPPLKIESSLEGILVANAMSCPSLSPFSRASVPNPDFHDERALLRAVMFMIRPFAGQSTVHKSIDMLVYCCRKTSQSGNLGGIFAHISCPFESAAHLTIDPRHPFR